MTSHMIARRFQATCTIPALCSQAPASPAPLSSARVLALMAGGVAGLAWVAGRSGLATTRCEGWRKEPRPSAFAKSDMNKPRELMLVPEAGRFMQLQLKQPEVMTNDVRA